MITKQSIKIEFLKGVDFLNQMILETNSKTGASYTFVAKYIENSKKIETVSLCYYNEIIENIQLDIENSPYEEILKSNECVFQSGIENKFVHDNFISQQGFTSYIGCPLFSVNEGGVIGILISFFKEEVIKPKEIILRFELLSPHIEMELDRSLLSIDLKESETRYKKLYRELVKSNLTLEKAQKVSKMGSWELNVATGKLDWSNQIYSIFNLDPSEFESTYEAFLDIIHPDDRDAVNEAYVKSLRTKKPYEIEHRLLHKDGSIAYVVEKCETYYDESGNPIKSLGTVVDITDKILGEQKIRKSEEKYRSIFNTLIDIYYKTNADGIIVEVSPSVLSMSGYEPNEVIGRKFSDFYKEPLEQVIFRDTIKDKREVINNYLTMLHKDGSEIEIELSSKALFDEKGEYIGAEGMARNVAERKKAEEDLNKINRLYATLVQVNQAIVRESDKESLFQQICNIVVKFGKFRLAWIGEVDKQNNVINSTAYSGDGSDYLKNIQLSIKDGELAKGPTGRAVLEQKSIIFNDLQTNPDFAPWREQALEKGYRSSATFPIWHNKNIIAVLNVYAVEAQFFDKSEVNLLEELSKDISFSLEKIKEKEERAKAVKALYEANIIINRSPVVAFLWKNEEGWPIEFVSDNVEKIFGYTVDEFLKGDVSYIEIIHPDDVSRVSEEVALASENIDVTSFSHVPYRIYSKSGEVNWIKDITHIRRNKEGRITHYEGIIYDVTEKIKTEELLEKERKLTLQAQFVGEEIEKNRISTELHDGLGQILTAAKLSLAALENNPNLDAEVKRQLKDVKALVNDANMETKRISMHLMPRILEDYGLLTAVERMLSDIGHILKIETSFEVDTELIHSKKNHVVIYRIIQEAVNNAVKYSDCSKLAVFFSEIDKYKVFKISDNGIGFNPLEVKEGLGLRNMRQRAKSINGELIVNSELNKGTEIIFKFI